MNSNPNFTSYDLTLESQEKKDSETMERIQKTIKIVLAVIIFTIIFLTLYRYDQFLSIILKIYQTVSILFKKRIARFNDVKIGIGGSDDIILLHLGNLLIFSNIFIANSLPNSRSRLGFL